LLVRTHAIGIAPEPAGASRWYTCLWGPWFVAGGAAFVLAARAHLRGAAEGRDAAIAGAVGGLGAPALSVAALPAGVGQPPGSFRLPARTTVRQIAAP